MDRKLEELMAQMAFGELSPSEEAKLQETLNKDSEAARSFAAYQRVQKELNNFEIPAAQLSKDRLRDAILNGGLDEKRKSSWGSWVWAPAAALFLAFGLAFYRNESNRSEPMVAMNEPLPQAVQMQQNDFRPLSSETPSTKIRSVQQEPAPNFVRPTRKVDTTRVAMNEPNTRRATQMTFASAQVEVREVSPEFLKGAQAAAPAIPSVPSADAQVVLIQDDSNALEPLSISEVENENDVVVSM